MESASTNSQSNAGRWTVVAMFGFAATMIVLLFLYWHFYTAPFRELQYAIAQQFPESSPRVVGGKHKSHKDDNPMVLRVIVYIPKDDFDPEASESLCESRAVQLAQLAFQHHDVSRYQQLQIVLLQKVPESKQRRWEQTSPVDQWRQAISARFDDPALN